MQVSDKAEVVAARLSATYGTPVWSGCANVMDELIGTMLSANTNDTNSARAFDQLRDTFGRDWEAVRTAPLDAIKAAIRPAGMYNQKAPNIVATLTRIQEDHGAYDLSFLGKMDVDEALTYLTSLPGVGHKTASIVLLFCFKMGAFPVDTHVQRISQRLGISGRSASAEKVKRVWEDLLPAQTYYALHVNLIRHGREICHARTPKCENCALQEVCDYGRGDGEWAAEGE